MPSIRAAHLIALLSLSAGSTILAQTAAPQPAAPTPAVRLRNLWTFAPPDEAVDCIAAHAGLVMVGLGSGSIAALRADDGSELWRRSLGSATVRGIVFTAQPKLDAVVLAVGRRIAVLDRLTGEPRWSRELPQAMATPVVVGNAVVAGGDDGKARALSLATGDELWVADFLQDAPADPPGFAGKQARYGDQLARPGSATADADTVYFAVFDQCRALTFDAARGTRKQDYPTRGWMFMRPMEHGELLLVGSQDGHCYCFDKASGAVRWRRQVGMRVEAACAVRDERVYWGACDGRVHCLDLVSGAVVWQQAIGSDPAQAVPIYEAPVITGRILLLPVLSGEVLALDRDSGRVLARHRPAEGAEIDGSAFDGSLQFVQTRATLAGEGLEAVFAIGR